jgi:hypothetical protein
MSALECLLPGARGSLWLRLILSDMSTDDADFLIICPGSKAPR